MSAEDEPRWVAKVHPLSRGAEPDDPLELMAAPVVGDPAEMLEGLLQEFAWLGYSAEQLWSMFSHPGYPLLCALRAHFGDEEVRRRVAALAASWGQLQFRETLVEPEEDHVQVVQIAPLPQTCAAALQRSPQTE
jgi:hypothetical protein